MADSKRSKSTAGGLMWFGVVCGGGRSLILEWAFRLMANLG